MAAANYWADLIGTSLSTFKIGKAKAIFDPSANTAQRTYTLPDASGTVRLGALSEITASPSANQNDYAPTGWAACTTMRLTPTTSVLITGLSAGTAGEQKTILNLSTDKLIVLADQSASSSAANRIMAASGVDQSHYVIYPGDAVTLEYDGTASRWFPAAERARVMANWVKRGLYATANSATVTPMGMAAVTTEAAGTAEAVATGSMQATKVRVAFISTSSAGASTGFRNATTLVANESTATRGGYLMRCLFAGAGPFNGGGSMFVGLAAQTGAIGNVDATSLINMIGIGWDPSDSNFQAMKNDGSGTATKTDLGSNYVWVDNGRIFDYRVFCPPGASGIAWSIWRADDLTVAPVVGYETTNLPAAATTFHAHAGNRAQAGIVSFRFYSAEFYQP